MKRLSWELPKEKPMVPQVKFGIRFTLNQYAYSEIDNFVECAKGLEADDVDNMLEQRYIDFLVALSSGKVKPSTLVDVDVLAVFADDLHNRASIDFLEGNWDDDADIKAGGKMFLGRYNKLKEVHPKLI
tara:strand:- start:6391 stop:6777 length:387 start_codon:yes stop_codon:yes gene_type:complete